MDHVSLDATRHKPARQSEAVAAGFEGKRNPRDCAPGPDRLVLPALQQGKQPFWARLQLLERLTLNPGKHAGNKPARLAHLDDGYDRAVSATAGSANLLFTSSTLNPSLAVAPVGMWAKASISPPSELAREAGEAQPVGEADRPHIHRPS